MCIQMAWLCPMMGSHFHSTCVLVLLIFSAGLSRGQVFYISPSHDTSCPRQPCSTLSELASNTSVCVNNSDVTLVFLSGNHILDRKLILSDANNISITTMEENVTVQCRGESVRFEVSSTSIFSLHGLQFIGCGGNSVTQVIQFILQYTIFQGLETTSTALILNDTSMSYIAFCEYFNNKVGSVIQEFEIPEIDTLISDENSNKTVGGAIIAINSNVVIDSVLFMNNSAQVGTAIFAGKGSNISVNNSQFIHETSPSGFGVLTIDCDCNLHVTNSLFSNNTVSFGVILSFTSAVSISDGSIFSSNTALFSGGTVLTYNSSLYIFGSIFVNNASPRGKGGAIGVFGGSSYVSDCNFIDNRARYGGVFFLFDIAEAVDGTLSCNLSNNCYINNAADEYGGVIQMTGGSLHITSDVFINNTAKLYGGAMYLNRGLVYIADTSFINNVAEFAGGAVVFSDLFMLVNNTKFISNEAQFGGIAHGFSSQVVLIDSNFEKTNALVSGVISLFLTSVNTFGTTFFLDNFGSLNLFYCNITFNGYTEFQNSKKSINSTDLTREGGAITSILSKLTFAGKSNFMGNEGWYGGAILAIETRISISGETMVSNNTATHEGGGLSLYQSSLEIKRTMFNCTFLQNNATIGGGIYASGSTINIGQPAGLHFVYNEAKDGGGIYLAEFSRLNVLLFNDIPYSGLLFSRNQATFRGGALYVDDVSYSSACTTGNAECFIQSFVLDLQLTLTNKRIIYFSLNTAATEVSASIFGGLLNACNKSQIVTASKTPLAGITYISEISNITLDSVSSLPVQVCFCNKEKPDCNYQLPTIQVKKGEPFSISLVAVDQVEHPVKAMVTTFLSSSEGGIDEGQQTQEVGGDCTDLAFNVFSPFDNEILNLYAKGPCGNSERSSQHVNIVFTTCKCPVGFQPSNSSTRCECVCDSLLSPYITMCDGSTNSLNRTGTNSWISYVNASNPYEYVIEPTCPFDYCHPPNNPITLNFNIPGGVNAQCANNRTGTLCGACQPNWSLSLGSTKCITCEHYWPAVFIVIVLFSVIAGLLLVMALLALNITVAGGRINVFIFYANIIAASKNSFFTFSESSFPAIFISWLNLDIGFDVCFFDGLNAYIKTWLQLAFPAYIISLVFLVIIVSHYSRRFAKLIGKRDPIATLATLILLSYTKLLSTSILVFSYTTLQYPNNTRVTVWLPDGNVEYYELKRIVFVVVAFILIFIGFLYTFMLFSWQWVIRAPRWKIFQWTNNTKLNAFIATYHAPYNKKHRYWTGLLLIVRVVVYITAAFTASDNPQVPLLAVIILLVGLFLLKEVIGMRVYRKLSVDVVETIMYCNLLVFAAFSLYNYEVNDSTKRVTLSYISTMIALTLLVGVVLLPWMVLFKNKYISRMTNEQATTSSDSNTNNGVTFSSVEIPYLESAVITSIH